MVVGDVVRMRGDSHLAGHVSHRSFMRVVYVSAARPSVTVECYGGERRRVHSGVLEVVGGGVFIGMGEVVAGRVVPGCFND